MSGEILQLAKSGNESRVLSKIAAARVKGEGVDELLVSALEGAVVGECFYLVECLIEDGGDVNFAMVSAVENDRPEIVFKLIDRYQYNQDRAVFIAAANKKTGLVLEMISRGGSVPAAHAGAEKVGWVYLSKLKKKIISHQHNMAADCLRQGDVNGWHRVVNSQHRYTRIIFQNTVKRTLAIAGEFEALSILGVDAVLYELFYGLAYHGKESEVNELFKAYHQRQPSLFWPIPGAKESGRIAYAWELELRANSNEKPGTYSEALARIDSGHLTRSQAYIVYALPEIANLITNAIVEINFGGWEKLPKDVWAECVLPSLLPKDVKLKQKDLYIITHYVLADRLGQYWNKQITGARKKLKALGSKDFRYYKEVIKGVSEEVEKSSDLGELSGIFKSHVRDPELGNIQNQERGRRHMQMARTWSNRLGAFRMRSSPRPERTPSVGTQPALGHRSE